MSETGETSQPNPAEINPKAEGVNVISPEKNKILEGIGKEIDDYLQQTKYKASLADSDIDEIKNTRSLREAGEIGGVVSGSFRRVENQASRQVAEEIGGNIRRSSQQIEEQDQLVRRTFRDGEESFSEFSDFTRRNAGEWESGAKDEFLSSIRKVLTGPSVSRTSIDGVYEEFRLRVLAKTRKMAESLNRKSSQFEGESNELGDRTIRGLIRSVGQIEELYRVDMGLYKSVAERVNTMLQQVRAYYSQTGEHRHDLPSRFKQIQNDSDGLENRLRNMLTQLSS